MTEQTATYPGHATGTASPSSSFEWLPDADLDPHPRLTWLVECAFDLCVDALYHKEEILPADYKLAPGTLIVSNHLRDSDIPVLTTTICQRRGRRILYPLPFYASREDILRPHFLRDLALNAGWDQAFASLPGWIPLRWLFDIVRARPLRRIREFNFNEAVAALCEAGLGDEPPARWLRGSTLAQIETRLGHVPETLSGIRRAHLGAYGLQFWGLRRLQPAAVRRIAPALRETIEKQLSDFATLLDAGRNVYMAPEGTLTDDGRMRPLRQGTVLIFARTKKTPPVRAVALSYDPFRHGRLRVVIRVGSVLEGLNPARPREFNARLKHALLIQHAVTPSHLLSRYLATGPAEFTLPELTNWMRRACAAVEKVGLTLDPLFARGAFDELVATRLVWLAQHRLVTRSEDFAHWHNLWERTTSPGRDRTLRSASRLAAAFDDWTKIAPGLEQDLKT